MIWSVRSVWSSASIQTTFKSEAQIVKLLLPCEFSEHKYIPHLRMESICPLRNRWGWRYLGLRARRGCCCVLEDAEGKSLISTTLSPEDQESVGCWIAWGLISFSFSLHSLLQSQETLSHACLVCLLVLTGHSKCHSQVSEVFEISRSVSPETSEHYFKRRTLLSAVWKIAFTGRLPFKGGARNLENKIDRITGAPMVWIYAKVSHSNRSFFHEKSI